MNPSYYPSVVPPPRPKSAFRVAARGNVLWDCVCYLDDEALSKISELGGVAVVVNSHPHFFTRMLDWAQHFGAKLYVHKADEAWVTRPDPSISFWTGVWGFFAPPSFGQSLWMFCE